MVYILSISRKGIQETTLGISGNGTQSIAWQINEETYRQKLEAEAGAPSTQSGLQVYYGSVHDILSYPCEVRTPLPYICR